MSRVPAEPHVAERLLAGDATDFERRVLEAALRTKPSPAASARMARALGVTVAAAGTATAATSVAATAAAAKASVTAGAAVVWPWLSAGVVALAVAGAVVGTRVARDGREPHAAPPARAPVSAPPPPSEAPVVPPPPVVAPPARAAVPVPHARAAVTGDLGDEIAFIDAARAALAAGDGRRALETLRRYQDRHPGGSFRPEAGAIKIEALMKIGRRAEARALAERFVAEYRGSLLARRVADVAGLPTP
jgi:hypothetical protein